MQSKMNHESTDSDEIHDFCLNKAERRNQRNQRRQCRHKNVRHRHSHSRDEDDKKKRSSSCSYKLYEKTLLDDHGIYMRQPKPNRHSTFSNGNLDYYCQAPSQHNYYNCEEFANQHSKATMNRSITLNDNYIQIPSADYYVNEILPDPNQIAFQDKQNIHQSNCENLTTNRYGHICKDNYSKRSFVNESTLGKFLNSIFSRPHINGLGLKDDQFDLEINSI